VSELRLVPDGADNEMSLVSAAAIDREQSPVLRLLLVCRDAGQPVLDTVQSLVIAVTDLNDNAPRFTRATYNVSVLENQRAPAVRMSHVHCLLV